MMAFDLSALIALGLCAGVVAGFFGIGGGTFIVPAMMAFGHDIKTAVGISIMQMIFSSVYGTYLNLKRSNLDAKDGIYVGIGGLFGASLSGVVVEAIPSKVLEIVFLLLVIYSIIRFSRPIVPKDSPPQSNMRNKIILITLGACTGVFAISLGIGGGLLLAPILALYLGYDSKKIIPISLFFVIFSSFSGFLSLAYHGYVDYAHGITVGIASLFGVSFGIWLISKTNAARHRKLLLLMYWVVLFFMLKRIFFA